MTSVNIDYQLVPPHIRRCNAAERAIRTFKITSSPVCAGLHRQEIPSPPMESILPTSSPDLEATTELPYQPQIVRTRLSSRRLRLQPNAHAQLHCAFDCNRKHTQFHDAFDYNRTHTHTTPRRLRLQPSVTSTSRHPRTRPRKSFRS